MSLAAALKSRPILIAALGLLSAYALGSLYQTVAAPAGCCGLTWPQPDPAQAERLLTAKDPKGLDAAVQRQAALDVLAARPSDINAWMRLAYADARAHRRLTDEGRHAFEMSYLAVPYAGADIPWRVGFALEHWNELSAAALADCMAEIKIAKSDPGSFARLKARAGQIRDPVGRLMASVLGLS